MNHMIDNTMDEQHALVPNETKELLREMRDKVVFGSAAYNQFNLILNAFQAEVDKNVGLIQSMAKLS